MHHRLGRALRIEFAGAFYHVTSRGNERKPIYRDDTDRQRFLSSVAGVVERFHLLMHAYVLMGNHYHLLVETLEPNLARAMQALNGDHAKTFNWAHGRFGHLFGRRYKAILVERDGYLVELSRYIHLNPVRAGIIDRADRYRWSSAPAYVGRRAASAFLTTADLLGRLGRTTRQAQTRYAEFLREGESLPPTLPFDKVTAGVLLGDTEWVHEMRGRIAACIETRHGSRDSVEIPAVSKMRLRPTLDQVIDAVSDAMTVDRQAICDDHSRSRSRAVAIHLAYNLTGLKQREIGEVFGIGRFWVSKAAAKIDAEMLGDARLRRLLTRLRRELGPPSSK